MGCTVLRRHSHLLFGQVLYGLRSSIMGCVATFFLQLCGLKVHALLISGVNRPLG